MKFLLLTVFALFNDAKAFEVKQRDAIKYKNIVVTLEPQESVNVSVGVYKHSNCWENSLYLVLGESSSSHFFFSKQRLMHPMVVCENPTEITEGVMIKLENTLQIPKKYRLFVPDEDAVNVEKIVTGL